MACELCERTILETLWQTEALRAAAPSSTGLAEEAVHTILDRVCDPISREGRWLTSLDFFSTMNGSLGNVPKNKV